MERHPDIVNAAGGTELLVSRLYDTLPSSLLDHFQIWASRYQPHLVNKSKKQLYYLHDCPSDPESDHLLNGGWDKFDQLIFVSNWQMQKYCDYYQIPMSKCSVLKNSIVPIYNIKKSDDTIKIGYWSTPHRGLNILVPVFDYLAKKHSNISLDVFSSFSLYGWSHRDEPYEPLFEQCRAHPQITYHGAVSNTEIREYVASAHILAYPSIWPETSCLVLMEAMSAKMVCVHSDLGALYETAANWTDMYHYHEDLQEHANTFCNTLDTAIKTLNTPLVQSRIESQKAYTDVFYNWDIRAKEWEILLNSFI